MGSEGFHEKVAEVRSGFTSLKQNRGSLPSSELSVIEEHLSHLTDSAEEYVQRKEERLFDLLNTIPRELSEQQLRERADLLIQEIQLGRVSPVKLDMCLEELGVRGELKRVWETENKCCQGKKKEDGLEFKQDVIQEIQLIETIQDQIASLDSLIRPYGVNAIEKDSLLLACRYLISDFRAAASRLELYLESKKYTVAPENRVFIQDIQNDLLDFMEKGNQILHVHDFSEPGSVTSDGRRFFTQLDVKKLIHNFVSGGNYGILIKSFLVRLKELKGVFRR